MSISTIWEHLYVVLIAICITVAIGVPLGIISYSNKKVRKIILWTVDILQTIPVLALLGLIMIVFGAGKGTVITGLVLYSLLPIVSNTYLGLELVDDSIKRVAKGMGMNRMQRLVQVELPMSFPTIFTGIRIATVTSIGIAVFGTFVGGGGLGKTIYNGIRTQNMETIVLSTGVLMLMAVVFDFGMQKIESILYKKYNK